MIHTVTPNPALDLTYRVPEIKIDDKIRAHDVIRAAGGNGINVSRVAARLGHETVAMGFIGGRSGEEIEDLLKAEGVRTWFTQHKEATRTNVIIQDDKSQQIRVSGKGATVTQDEVECLVSNIMDLRKPDFLVISGGLLEGMPKDFYIAVTRYAVRDGIPVAADADGDALRSAVQGGVYLIKPNHYELGRLTHIEVKTHSDAVKAAKKVLDQGVEVVVCSLGPSGAVLVTEKEAWQATPPTIKVDSAVGAGDSLLAGVLVAKGDDKPWDEVLRLGVACGSATAMSPGTDLCYVKDIEMILPQVKLERLAM
ncbi:MAG: 1-phosphofructokinase [Trueperaceae bacterium]